MKMRSIKKRKMKKQKTYTSNVKKLTTIFTKKKENSRLNCFVRFIHLNRKMIFFFFSFSTMALTYKCFASSQIVFFLYLRIRTWQLVWNFDGIANYPVCLFSSEPHDVRWLWCAGICLLLRGRRIDANHKVSFSKKMTHTRKIRISFFYCQSMKFTSQEWWIKRMKSILNTNSSFWEVIIWNVSATSFHPTQTDSASVPIKWCTLVYVYVII
jgi:hypothetical protein